MRRASRLRLYIATLLLARLRGKHGYDPATIQRVLETDFRKAKFITNEDEVSQANDRIEFLLDTAEMRVREAALCSWDYVHWPKLNQCIAMIVNGFFIDMVGTLGGFFDSSVFVEEMKGFGSKL